MKKYIMFLLWCLLWLFILCLLKHTNVIADDNIAQWNPQSVQEAIEVYSKKYNVSEKLVSEIISCESSYNTNAHNKNKWEDSYGLVQINLKSHKDVTIEQATDYNFATEFLSSNLANGNGKMWSCYKIVKGVK